MSLFSSSTSIIEDRDSSMQLDILTIRHLRVTFADSEVRRQRFEKIVGSITAQLKDLMGPPATSAREMFGVARL